MAAVDTAAGAVAKGPAPVVAVVLPVSQTMSMYVQHEWIGCWIQDQKHRQPEVIHFTSCQMSHI